MACDAQTLINTAYAAGYAGLSERDLWETIAASACAGGGGGGGGATQVFSGAADPVADPGVTPALYINTTTQVLWQWFGAAWH